MYKRFGELSISRRAVAGLACVRRLYIGQNGAGWQSSVQGKFAEAQHHRAATGLRTSETRSGSGATGAGPINDAPLHVVFDGRLVVGGAPYVGWVLFPACIIYAVLRMRWMTFRTAGALVNLELGSASTIHLIGDLP